MVSISEMTVALVSGVMPRRVTVAIAVQLLCTLAVSTEAQSDSGGGRPAERHAPSATLWGTVGLGSAQFGPQVASSFPPSIVEGWLAVGPVGVALRRVDAGSGINTTERIDNAWLLGTRTNVGPLLLIAGAGRANVSGRNSNREQSGSSGAIDARQSWTAEGELSLMLGRYVGV